MDFVARFNFIHAQESTCGALFYKIWNKASFPRSFISRSVYECIGRFSNTPRHTWHRTPLRIWRWWHNFRLNRPRCIFTSSLRISILAAATVYVCLCKDTELLFYFISAHSHLCNGVISPFEMSCHNNLSAHTFTKKRQSLCSVAIWRSSKARNITDSEPLKVARDKW